MSAPARIVATIRRFGTARNRTAVAAAELDVAPGADGCGAPGCGAPATHPARILLLSLIALLALSLLFGVALATAAPPAVTIENATNVTATTADVEGTVNPEGQSTTWRFQYTARASFDAEIIDSLYVQNGPNGTTETAETLTEQLINLQPNTTYHLRLLATNADGQSQAVAAQTFTTPAAKPTVTTAAPDPVGPEKAALDGVVDTRNSPTTYWYEWGTEDCEVSPSACQSTTHASAGFNEIQEINLPNNENGEGEWNLSFEGQTTPDFPANPTGAAVQVALENLSTIGPGNVSVTGAAGSWEYLITFTGALANTDVGQVTAANGANPLPGNIEWKTVLQGGYRSSPKHVTHILTDLQPETTYHFRLVAENSSGTTEAPDRQFTTTGPEPACTNQGMPGTTFLPDCRAYELVSPSGPKNGADVQAESHLTFSSVSGDGLAYITNAGFGDVRGTTPSVQYVGRRTGAPGTNGWSSHAVDPAVFATEIIAGANSNIPVFEAFNPELTAAVYRSWSTLAEYPEPKVSEVTNLYRLDNLDAADPPAQLLTASNATLAADSYTKRTLKNAYVGASQNLSHVFFQSAWNLTSDGTPTSSNSGDFFEYTDGVGVRRVGRIPSGSDTQCNDLGTPLCVDANAEPAFVQEVHLRGGGYTDKTISTNGSRVLFKSTEEDPNPGQLYMRENGAITYHVNASERTPAAAPAPANFQAMTPDGSRVFFTTQEPLVNADEDAYSTDLYMYEVEKPVGHRLTLLSGRSVEAEAKHVVGTSTDGHYVYFIASGQLVPGEPLVQRNGLYLWHDGAISFIGNFGEADDTPAANSIGGSNWSWPTANLSSRVTPDGRTLLFMSEESGAFSGRGGYPGHNNGGTLCNTAPIGGPSPIGAHQPCRELYLYSADTGRIVCVSCNPESDVATGDALTDLKFANTVNSKIQHVSNALSTDGRHVFFTSGEALVPEDTNGNWDAYEYDVATESIHLISNGTDPQGAYFLDASPDGRNVFFATTQQLVGWDTDNNSDAYDARVGGGFPEPVPVPAACQGESCLPSVPPAPNAPSIASPAPKPGNPTFPRRCPKGSKSVKRHGKARCVKKRHAKHRKANTNRRAGR